MFSKAEKNALEIKAFTLSGGFPRFRFWVARVLKAFSSVGMWVCRAICQPDVPKARLGERPQWVGCGPSRQAAIGQKLPVVTGW